MRLHAIRLTRCGEPILMRGTSKIDPESGGGGGDLATILDLDDITHQFRTAAILISPFIINEKSRLDIFEGLIAFQLPFVE